MNMKRSLILLCGLLTGFTLQSTKVNAQTQTVANDQKLVYPYTFAPSEGLVNQTEKEHRQEICINGYWDFQPVCLPKEYVQEKVSLPNFHYRKTTANGAKLVSKSLHRGISMLLLTVTWKVPTTATILHTLKNGNK